MRKTLWVLLVAAACGVAFLLSPVVSTALPEWMSNKQLWTAIAVVLVIWFVKQVLGVLDNSFARIDARLDKIEQTQLKIRDLISRQNYRTS